MGFYFDIGRVLQPPCAEDYRGEVEQYKIFNEQMEEMICTSASSQCSVQIPSDFQSLRISAVTLDGVSPPADVPLRHSGMQILEPK